MSDLFHAHGVIPGGSPGSHDANHQDCSGIRCPGPKRMTAAGRREFIRMGLAGFTSLSLPGLMQLRARAESSGGAKPSDRERTAVIMVWKPGGCSHIDTYDQRLSGTVRYDPDQSPRHAVLRTAADAGRLR